MKIIALAVLCLLSTTHADSNDADEAHTHCTTGSISIAGTSSFHRLATAWASEFRKTCPLAMQMEEGEWSSGGARVCANHLIEPPVDMAGMSGKFFRPQATSVDGFNYDCRFSDRTAMLVPLAYEGVAVLVGAGNLHDDQDTSAEDCYINWLEGGLGYWHLKWMLSSLSASEFYRVTTDKSVTKNWDGNATTRLWSEVHPNCSAIQIDVVTVRETDDGSNGPTINFLKEAILTTPEEDIRPHIEVDSLAELADYLAHKNKAAIGVVQLGDLRRAELQDTSAPVVPLALQGYKTGSKPVFPHENAFHTREYYLSKPVNVGLHNDPTSLARTSSFVEFGFSETGTHLLQSKAGMWPISKADQILDRTRLGMQGGIEILGDQNHCPPRGHHISIDGSSAALFVALPWKELYKAVCPGAEIKIESAGSTIGAERICGKTEDQHNVQETLVDISLMSRPWKESEASNEMRADEFVYDCVHGDSSRSVIEVDIALDGIVMAVRSGTVSDECQQILGGFTLDQIRWIYSNYSEKELEATGWDPTALKNSDHDPSTHLWSELDPRCAPSPIHLSGHPVHEGGFDKFVDLVMKDHENGETIALDRPGFSYLEGTGIQVVNHLLHHTDAMAFVSYSFFAGYTDILTSVPIQNLQGNMVAPSIKTFQDGSYHPGFTRKLTANILNDAKALLRTEHLLHVGLAHPEFMSQIGLVPIQGKEVNEMMHRIHNGPYNEFDMGEGDGDEEKLWLVLGASLGIFIFLVCLGGCGFVFYRFTSI